MAKVTSENAVTQASSLQRAALLSGTHSRGYLPHWKVDGATYFVNFRLAGSLPHSVLDRLEQEHRDRMQRLSRLGNLSEKDKRQLQEQYAARIDEHLDLGHGNCRLNQPRIAEMVAIALRHFDGSRYHLHAYVIMPNHVHVLVTPLEEHTLTSILHSWKTYTAREGNRLLNRAGQDFWQRESYDHIVRDEAEFMRILEYIRNNPVKARLTKEAEDWPYLWMEGRKSGDFAREG